MKKKFLKSLVDQNLSIREISKQVDKSYSTVRYYLNKFGLKTNLSFTSISGNLECIVCDNKLTGLQTKFCSNSCKHRSTNNKHNNYQKQQARGKKRKLRALEKFGGKCQICGYSKNIAALTFHHLNPNDKSISLDMRSFSNNSLKKLEKEINKCILLCMNCHTEIHNQSYTNLDS